MLQLLARDSAVPDLPERSGRDATAQAATASGENEALGAFAAWDARAYLADYYLRLEPDEELTLEFLVQEFSRIAPGATALEFGAGPALHHLLPLAPHVREVHVAGGPAQQARGPERVRQRFGETPPRSPNRPATVFNGKKRRAGRCCSGMKPKCA